MYPDKKRWNFQEVRKAIRFRCPHCHCEHKDSLDLRREMNRLAKYIITNPNAPEDHRSFQANQLAAWWKGYEEIVERSIKATELQKTGDLKELRLFIIESLGETWQMQNSPDTQADLSGGYSINDEFKWEEEAIRFMTVDVQDKDGRHFWVVVRAWSKEGESRLVRCARKNSWLELDEFRKENLVSPGHVGVDCRFRPKEVRENTGKRGWLWLMAAEGKNREWLHPGPVPNTTVRKIFSDRKMVDVFQGTRQQGMLFAPGFQFSKEWAMECLANRINGLGTAWKLPHDIHMLPKFQGTRVPKCTYMEQLHSWTRYEETDKKTNAKFERWKQVFGDDHFRAAEELQLVMAALKGYVPLDVPLL